MKFVVFRVVNNVQIVNQSASPAHSVTLIDLFHFSLDLKLKSNSINLNAFKRMSLFCWSSPPGGTRINQLIFNLTLQCVFIFHLKYVLTTVDWSARATVVSSFDFFCCSLRSELFVSLFSLADNQLSFRSVGRSNFPQVESWIFKLMWMADEAATENRKLRTL